MALLVPAILAKTPEEFTEKLDAVAPFCKRVQVDIMDGKFVKNNTISVSQIPKFNNNVKLELHLMMNDPMVIFGEEKHPAVTTVIMHYESLKDPEGTILSLPKRLMKGIAINPETPVSVLEPFIKNIDIVLLMSVSPGFDGQQFLPVTLSKIIELRNMRQGVVIEVDGGVHRDNAADVANAGADQVVVGSEIFESRDFRRTIRELMIELGDIEGVGV